MDSQFYRTLQPKRLLRDISRKAAKHKRRTILLVIGLLVVLYLLLDNKGVLARIGLEMRRQEMIDQVQADTLETRNLQSQIKSLEGDKKTIEKVARERHGMARKGETVYRTKKDE
jgi:cell division protein FtsB